MAYNTINIAMTQPLEYPPASSWYPADSCSTILDHQTGGFPQREAFDFNHALQWEALRDAKCGREPCLNRTGEGHMTREQVKGYFGLAMLPLSMGPGPPVPITVPSNDSPPDRGHDESEVRSAKRRKRVADDGVMAANLPTFSPPGPLQQDQQLLTPPTPPVTVTPPTPSCSPSPDLISPMSINTPWSSTLDTSLDTSAASVMPQTTETSPTASSPAESIHRDDLSVDEDRLSMPPPPLPLRCIKQASPSTTFHANCTGNGGVAEDDSCSWPRLEACEDRTWVELRVRERRDTESKVLARINKAEAQRLQGYVAAMLMAATGSPSTSQSAAVVPRTVMRTATGTGVGRRGSLMGSEVCRTMISQVV